MTRIQKIKRHMADHREDYFVFGFYAAVIGSSVYLHHKMQEQIAIDTAARDQFILESNKAGKTVYQLANGSFLAVTPE